MSYVTSMYVFMRQLVSRGTETPPSWHSRLNVRRTHRLQPSGRTAAILAQCKRKLIAAAPTSGAYARATAPSVGRYTSGLQKLKGKKKSRHRGGYCIHNCDECTQPYTRQVVSFTEWVFVSCLDLSPGSHQRARQHVEILPALWRRHSTRNKWSDSPFPHSLSLSRFIAYRHRAQTTGDVLLS